MKLRKPVRRALSRASLAALIAWAALGAGCAQERDPINRVQANAMDKHFFVGANLADATDDPEFYWRNYVVDASASQSLVGVGSWGHVDRVRWEITEDMLVARKAYQIADGQDDKGVPQSGAAAAAKNMKGYTPTANGTIVAAFKIDSHFDIRRDYNPQTGEELNIVEENSTDRPWQQREYMRVDWSKNLVDNNPMWEDMFTGKVFGNFDVTPVSYYVSDPSADDAIHVDAKQGYLDVTNKYSLTPATTDSPFSDYAGKVPTCMMVGMYTGSSTYECDAQEATVRSSFLRIDPNADFEPLENTRATLDVVGNPGGIGDSREIGVVSAGRQGWDPQYGYTDALFHRFAYVHNIWKQSHQTGTSCAANDDVDHDGTADACSNDKTGYAGSNGSQCDVFVGKCTIPVRDREIKTVGYWVNKEAPDDVLDPIGADGKPTGRGALEDLIFSWNQLLSVSVATSREVECRRTGDGSRDECHARFFDSTNDPASKQMVSYGGWLTDKPKEGAAPVLTFCHNPVRSYDLTDTCGAVGDKARVGDVRKNFVFYWPYESRAPWGGIADWNADPLTGQIIGAAAQIMGRSATYAAAMERDVIQVAIGDTKLSDILDGVPAQTYARQLVNGSSPKGLTADEIAKRTASVDLDHLRTSLGAKPFAGATPEARVKSELLESRTAVSDPRQVSTALLEYDALAKQLQGGKYEAQLVDSHWMVGALGASPNASVDDSALEMASPLRSLDPGRRHAMQDLIGEGLHARGVCYLESEAPAVGSVYMASLAGYFKNKYGGMSPKDRGEAIYHDLFKEAVKGIALHEIGHSLGLLHQFASSWDAPNYNPQYWQLRTNEGQSTASCNGKPRAAGDNDTCMGPRYLDPPTADEQGLAAESRPAIEYFGNTSTMEYQIERGGESVGLGTYDQHAMKALYGRVLETFDERVLPPSAQTSFKFKNWSQLQDRDIVDGRFAHYTETARGMKVFDPKRDCRPATDDEKTNAAWRVVHGKVCAPPPKDHWAWQDFQSDSLDGGDPQFNAPYWHVKAKDVKNGDLIRWPYRYGTSHNAYFHTNDSDAGADAYEVTLNTARKFELSYPWAYFRRQNREYYYPGLPSATADRYFDRVRSYHWLVATDLARVASPTQLSDDDDLRPQVMAQSEMFNMLASALLMPEPGDYYGPDQSPDVKARQPIDSLQLVYDTATPAGGVGGASGPAFTLGIGQGRFIGEEYDNDLGGSWNYLDYIKHAGFGVEKALAVQALVDGRPTLFTISRDNFLDGRAVKINFRNDLPDAIDRLVGGILAQDWETVAMYAPQGSDATPVSLDLMTRTTSPGRPDGSRVLFPNLGYKQQLAGVMFATLFSRLNTDMTLVNKMRIWIDGEVGGVSVPAEEQVRYTDPTSGYTYIARKYGNDTIDNKTVDRGIASRMLAHASALLGVAYQTKKDTTGKTVVDSFGQPVLVKDPNGLPVVADAGRASELTEYVGLVDALREIGYKLGYGPLGGGGGGGD